MKKRLRTTIAALFLAGTLLGMTACGPTSQGPAGGKINGVTVTMPDGRQIPCVVWDGDSHAGGLSCDWSVGA